MSHNFIKLIQMLLLIIVFGISTLHPIVLRDRTHLMTYEVSTIQKPHTYQELSNILSHTTLPISISGASYCQGGQNIAQHGVVIDMNHFNNVVAFDPLRKEITVQAGIRWYDVQKYIDPYNLSVKVMQSYNNFSVGGSIAVNCHARDMRYGTLVNTIVSLQIMLADGTIVTANRTTNNDLFIAAVGGYGLVGIVLEATLSLTDNSALETDVHTMSVQEYALFVQKIQRDPATVFHNAHVVLPQCDRVITHTWRESHRPTTITHRLRTARTWYPKNIVLDQLVRRVHSVHHMRPWLEHTMTNSDVVWRNYEMSYNVQELAMPLHFPTTAVLQEYFVPIDTIASFIDQLKTIKDAYHINILNVSIRHVPADTTTLLSYARQESYAFVLYIAHSNSEKGKLHAADWTQALVDAALSCNGTYYLPYQLYALPEQFRSAYPQLQEFLGIKKKYDPQTRFSNTLFQKYMANA